MKLFQNVIFCLVFFSFDTNAQSLNSDSLNSSDLHGRWHMVKITLELDDSNGLDTKAEEVFKKSSASQDRVKKQIQDGELAIITQFNYDSTYTHELVFSDSTVRFPSYRESGTWFFNPETRELSRKSKDQEVTTLELTVVKRLNRDELILELRYTDKEYDGIYKGLVETVFLRRFREVKAKLH